MPKSGTFPPLPVSTANGSYCWKRPFGHHWPSRGFCLKIENIRIPSTLVTRETHRITSGNGCKGSDLFAGKCANSERVSQRLHEIRNGVDHGFSTVVGQHSLMDCEVV